MKTKGEEKKKDEKKKKKKRSEEKKIMSGIEHGTSDEPGQMGHVESTPEFAAIL